MVKSSRHEHYVLVDCTLLEARANNEVSLYNQDDEFNCFVQYYVCRV